MSHLSLASRYRPQSFAEVGGQELVTSALSRAAANDNPAAAYLLSGTRGVGKTTIARIFAKALNCEKGPGPEPCNECPQCRKITEGRHVDVCEIDGASNNRVEDARSLRENIGYAPMEGRYKVFIIDEAHMLSNSAFNALLKTLEEPPSRVVFIFATTEAHKFPITIVSRCQHFVFNHLSEDALARHLGKILKLEGVPYEDEALRILARRAAGSVRDSLSLLDQVLALGGEKLTADETRSLLGLAGRELFDGLFSAFAKGDLGAIIKLCGQILSRGLDIGYFLRDLSANIRNLFLLSQDKNNILPVLGLSQDEASFLLGHVESFSGAHLHAAWQLALSCQREIVQNPEPSTALEMLLLNIALLPRLLPIENMPEGMGNDSGMRTRQAEKGPTNITHQENSPANRTPEYREANAGENTARENIVESEKPAVPGAAASLRPRDVAVDAEQGDSNPGHDAGMTEHVRKIGVNEPPNWPAFRKFCANLREEGKEAPPAGLLSAISGVWQDGKVVINTRTSSALESAKKQLRVLQDAMRSYCGDLEIVFGAADGVRSENEIRSELENSPELKACMEILDAKITQCREK